MTALLYPIAGLFASLYSAGRQFLSSIFVPKSLSLELRDLTSPPLGAGALCVDFIKHWGGTTIYRDEKYLQWRIFDSPSCKANMVGAYAGEELVGYCCFSIGADQIGYIVDVIATKPAGHVVSTTEIVHRLLRVATGRLADMGASGVRGWNMTSHKFDRLVFNEAKKLGYFFIKQGSAVVLHRRFNANSDGRVEDFSDWSTSRLYTEGRTG